MFADNPSQRLGILPGGEGMKSSAARQGIPEAYLEQLIAVLRREKLVLSNRGAQGGYRLARSPEEITVGDVLRALEGGLNLVECLDEEDACGKSCATGSTKSSTASRSGT